MPSESPSSSAASSSQAAAPAPRRRRCRWLRWSLAALGLVLVLLLSAPLWLSGVAEGFLLDGLETAFPGTARVTDFSLSGFSGASLRELEMEDEEGRPLLRVGRAAVEASPLAALGGRYQAALEIEGVEIHLRRRPDGGWNLIRRASGAPGGRGRSPGSGGGGGSREEAGGEPSSLPDLDLDLRLRGGRILIHDGDGATEIGDISLDLRIPGPSQEMLLDLQGVVRGPAGEPAPLRLELRAALPEGRLQRDGLAARLDLALEHLDLEALAPAARAAGAAGALEGALDGSLSARLEPESGLQVRSAWTLAGLAVVPAGGGEPLRLEEASLQGEAALDPAGTGTHRLELRASPGLTAQLEGSTEALFGGRPGGRTRLRWDGDLPALTASLGSFLPLREGVVLQAGVLDGDLLLERRPGADAWRVQGEAGARGIAAAGEGGTALDLEGAGDLILRCDASWQAGALEMPVLELAAGPLQARGRASFSGLAAGDPAALQVREGNLEWSADLARLQRLADRLFAAVPFRLDGVLEGGLELRDGTEAGTFELRSEAVGNGLVLGGLAGMQAGEVCGPFFLGFEAEATVAPFGAGRSLLRRCRLVSDLLEADLGGEVVGLLEPEHRSGRLALDLRILLPEAARLLRAWAPGLELEGDPLRPTAQVAFGGGGWSAVARLEAPSLRYRSGAGPEDWEVARATAALDLGVEEGGGPLVLRSARLSSARITGPALTLEGLEASAGGSLAEDGFALHLEGGGARLVLPGAGENPSVQEDLEFLADLAGEKAAAGTLVRLERLRLALPSGEARASGVLGPFGGSAGFAADLALELQAGVARLLQDLGPVLPAPGGGPWQGGGDLQGRWTLKGEGGRLSLDGRAALTDLDLSVPQEEAPPFRLQEPELRWELASELDADSLDLVVERFALEAGFLDASFTGRLLGIRSVLPGQGTGASVPDEALPPELRLEGLHGELRYVPEALGALLAPFAPDLRLAGEAEEELVFDFEGRAADLDLWSLLRGTRGEAKVGLAWIEVPGLRTRGSLGLRLDGERVEADGTLDANGGEILLDLALDLRPEASEDAPFASRLGLEARAVEASALLSPLLSRIHPALATAADAGSSALGGVLDLRLDLEYDGPLTPEEFAGGFETLPKRPFRGSGSLALQGARVQGSPLLGELVSRLGADSAAGLELEPVSFQVERGELVYEKPLTLRLAGVETRLFGRMGLDQGLQMEWEVPVTPELVQRYSFLGSLQGRSLRVPLRGTVTAPELAWDEALAGLAKEAVQGRLEEELGGRLPGGVEEALGGLLGGERKPPPDPKETEAADWLRRADLRWKEGKTKRAGVLYRKLLDEYASTEVVRQNRERIEERAAEGEGGA